MLKYRCDGCPYHCLVEMEIEPLHTDKEDFAKYCIFHSGDVEWIIEKEQGDSEVKSMIKELAQEESDFYNKHGYFSFWSDKLKAQRIKEQNEKQKRGKNKIIG